MGQGLHFKRDLSESMSLVELHHPHTGGSLHDLGWSNIPLKPCVALRSDTDKLARVGCVESLLTLRLDTNPEPPWPALLLQGVRHRLGGMAAQCSGCHVRTGPPRQPPACGSSGQLSTHTLRL